MNSKVDLKKYERNIRNYQSIGYLNASILIWGVMTLYYAYKGLSFLQIALIQSIGSIVTIALEIPLGWVSDKYGHARILKLSAVCRVIFVLLLIISKGFIGFLAAEVFASIASAAQSGADTALFYDSLTQTGQKDKYSSIMSKIRGRQSLIRIFARLAAPVLFSLFADLPFIISAVIYLLIAFISMRYVTPTYEEIAEKEEKKKEPREKSGFAKAWDTLKNVVLTHKVFIAYCLLSSFVLISVSNYSQYIGPFLEERGLDIKWLGVVMAMASIGDYVGTKLVDKIKDSRRSLVLILLAIAISGFVIWGGVNNTIISAALGYFGINLIYSPFVILLGEKLNEIIDSKHRATLLSVSNQVDEFSGIIADPIIGRMIDTLGFGNAYRWMGMISLIFLMIVVFVIKFKEKVSG